MKIAIVGSRNFSDLTKVRDYVNTLPPDTIVISGGAKGVDTVAETTAKAKGLTTIVYLPEWKKYGRSAGIKRNEDIIHNAEAVIAFWDGNSPGTRNSINQAKENNKKVTIIY